MKKNKNYLSRFSSYIYPKRFYLVLTILGFFVYGKSLFNGFVWDDVIAIVENEQMLSYTVKNILGPNIYNDGNFYRPLSAFYFFTLFKLFTLTPFFYHLAQLILHILITGFLYKFFKKFFEDKLAFILSLVFLTHPINTEPVAFISGGQALIYSIFGIIGLNWVSGLNLNIKRFSMLVLLMLLTILAKEEGLQYLLIINIYCFLFQKHFFRWSVIATMFTGIFYFAIRFVFANDLSLQSNLFNQNISNLEAYPVTIVASSFYQKLLNIPLVIYYYIKTFLYPSKLAIYQIWAIKEFDLSTFIFPVFFIILFFSILVLIGTKIYKQKGSDFKIYLFFLTWFLTGLFLHLPILQPFNMTVADRWFYFPIIGLLGLIGLYIQNLFKSNYKPLFIFSCLLVITLLSVRSHIRSLNFHDDITLFEHDSRFYSNSLIEQNLGFFYLQTRELDKSIEHSFKSVQYFPTVKNYLGLALALELDNQLERAEVYYRKAYESPNFYYSNNAHTEDVYFFSSRFFLRINKPDEALKILERGLVFYQNSDRLFIVSGISKYNKGLKKDALEDIDKAIKLSPEDVNYKNIYTSIQNGDNLINPI